MPGRRGSYWLSAALAALLVTESVSGLVVPELYRDTPGWAAQARGVNLIDLTGTLPALVLTIALSARGSRRARVVWFGVLGYVLYNAAIFAFEIAFNRLFLVYVGVLGLAVFGLLAMAIEGDLPIAHVPSAPRVTVSVYLLLVAALFLLAWLAEIVPALISDTTPRSIVDARLPTNPVYVLDLGILIPLYVVVAAAGLARRSSHATMLAGALLVLNVLLSLSIVASALFQHAVDETASLAVIPWFGAIAVSSALLAVWYLSSWRQESPPT
jgi:hypothetical protein